MHAILVPALHLCARGVRVERLANSKHVVRSSLAKQYSGAAGTGTEELEKKNNGGQAASHVTLQQGDGADEKEEGSLTRRLREMSEEALESGGHSARKAIEEASFSAELKAQLEQRIAAAQFRSSEADMPQSASQQARELARAEVWTGTESLHDASLRMLNDAHKPMRLGRPPRAPGVQMPKTIDTGRKRNKEHRGLRLANARDRSGLYASVKDDPRLEAADREKQLQEMKDRFEPGARSIVPGSIQGLTSLANQRIEDAIARGQFKNIPRGKGKNVERDHNANSPFIDTTEYFMNKIIQKQEIVPPWIEKQQELTSAASKFRSRLRAEWKRHAARMIASKGGSLQDQLQRAEAYAQAELVANPLRKKQETLVSVNSEGQLSQITLSGELKMQPPSSNSTARSPMVTQEIVLERKFLPPQQIPGGASEGSGRPEQPFPQAIEIPVSASTPTPTVAPAPFPFRDPDWERVESSYHNAVIKDLNSKCRSYNLQAPELAKRPYFSIQRELNSCYADIAPQLAEAILDRTRRPPKTSEPFGQGAGNKGLFSNIVGDPVRIRDERTTKQYGFKQFWNDLWSGNAKSPQ